MKNVSDLPFLDFDSAQYADSPFTTLANWAKSWKIARSRRGVELLDYDLCRRAIVDPDLGTGHPRLMKEIGLPESAALEFKRNAIGFHNRGERRRKLRQPLNRLFAPPAIEKFRAGVRSVVREVVEDLPKDQPADLILGLCDPIPSLMYCHWIDAPKSDAPFVGEASHTVQQVHTRNPEHTKAIVESFDTLIAYVEDRIQAKRNALSDDLLSDLIRAQQDGELSALDLRNWVIVLAAANTDNTSHSIATTIIELASRPQVWKRLGNDPDAVKGAVSEVMRFHPRSISTSREAMQDMQIEGVALPKGTAVFANFGASHWNPNYYPQPESFDIDRKGEPAHMNFGGGIFSCIGRFFVTMEIEETITFLAANYPDLMIVESEFEHSPMFTSVTKLVAQLQK